MPSQHEPVLRCRRQAVAAIWSRAVWGQLRQFVILGLDRKVRTSNRPNTQPEIRICLCQIPYRFMAVIARYPQSDISMQELLQGSGHVRRPTSRVRQPDLRTAVRTRTASWSSDTSMGGRIRRRLVRKRHFRPAAHSSHTSRTVFATAEASSCRITSGTTDSCGLILPVLQSRPQAILATAAQPS
jgi:hypothetical protein